MPGNLGGASPSRFTPDDGGEGWTSSPQADEPWLDVEAIQRRLNRAARLYKGWAVHSGCFRTPWPLTKSQYEQLRNMAIKVWLSVQEKRDFTLESKVHIRGPFSAYGTSGDWYTLPLLDQREFRVFAAFSKKNAKPVRIELPVYRVKKGERQEFG